MAQSLNQTVWFQAKGVYYTGLTNQIGHLLLGETALEFYPDANVERFVQIPWGCIDWIGAVVSNNQVKRHFKVSAENKTFLFASKYTGNILKLARREIGNEKVVRLPSFWQVIKQQLTKSKKYPTINKDG